MNAWIFQAVPEEYPILEKMKMLKTENWRVTRYFRPATRGGHSIERGDIVYFWVAGKQGGLCGWGHVLSDKPYLTDDGNYRATVSFEQSFGTPIPKSTIQNSGLEEMHILKAPQGTNFKVKHAEAVELNRLIVQAGYIAPALEGPTDD